jgi:flagellar hook-associated protein 3 FlgL
MALTTIGDLSQHLVSVRHTSQLKERLNTLTQEVSTGRVADLAAHLGGDQQRYLDTGRQLDLLTARGRSLDETANMLSVVQSALGAVQDAGAAAGETLLTVSAQSGPTHRATAAIEARTAFEGMVSAVNTRRAEHAVLAGAESDKTPLPPASDMLDDIRAAASGATDADGVIAAVDAWFDTPEGGFMTTAYGGSTTTNLSRPIVDGETLEITARADHPAVRGALKAAALGAIAEDPGLSLPDSARADLLRHAGEALVGGTGAIVQLRATVGSAEARVEDAAARLSARGTALEIARNDMSVADPYETATKLQNVQLQLETHYTLTARLSRLSLTEYLR